MRKIMSQRVKLIRCPTCRTVALKITGDMSMVPVQITGPCGHSFHHPGIGSLKSR